MFYFLSFCGVRDDQISHFDVNHVLSFFKYYYWMTCQTLDWSQCNCQTVLDVWFCIKA